MSNEPSTSKKRKHREGGEEEDGGDDDRGEGTSSSGAFLVLRSRHGLFIQAFSIGTQA